MGGAVQASTTRQPVSGFDEYDQSAEQGLQLGQQVHHPKFGYGTVLQCEGSGAQARVQVSFEDVGTKWLMLAYANLSQVA